MYVIVVYDVDQSRVGKVCQYLRRFLHWVQNSAFEGEVTESQLAMLKEGLRRIIDPQEDSVYIYELNHRKFMKKHIIGTEKGTVGFIVE